MLLAAGHVLTKSLRQQRRGIARPTPKSSPYPCFRKTKKTPADMASDTNLAILTVLAEFERKRFVAQQALEQARPLRTAARITLGIPAHSSKFTSAELS